MDASLRTQIRAMQSRIDSVAATATPEDIVMLAKGMEAVAGQATVFDILEAGEEAAAKALDAIEKARDDALDAVAEAGDFAEQLNQSVALLKSRNRVVSVSIPIQGIQISDATTGYIRAVAEDKTGALILPELTPEWLADDSNMQVLTICNDGNRAISAIDSEGQEVCAIPDGMYALVFVVDDGDTHKWRGTRLGSTGVDIVTDQEATFLDSADASTISIAPTFDPVACWNGTVPRVCRFQWIDGVLVPVQTLTVTTTGSEARIVAYDDQHALMVTRNSNTFYGVMLTVGEVGADGLTAGTSRQLFSMPSGYSYNNWTLLPNGVVYTATDSPTIVCHLRTISYNAGEDRFSVGGNSGLFSRNSSQYNYAGYLGKKSAATIGSRTLVLESNRNAMYPGHLWVNSGGNTPWGSDVLSASFGSNCQGIFEVNDTTFLILWTGSASVGLYWRLGKLNGSTPIMGNYGQLIPAEYTYFDTADWFGASVIDNGRKVAIVTGGGAGKRAMLFIGALSENADTFTQWFDPIFLPIGTPANNPVIDMMHDKGRNVLYIVRTATGIAPHILPVKL